MRNFFDAVEDITPDEAFMLTTVGYTKPAQKYAEAKGIRLAVLRPPEGAQDWGNLVRRVVVELRPIIATNVRVKWQVDEAEYERARPLLGEGLAMSPTEMVLRDDGGRTERFSEIWEGVWRCIGPDVRGEIRGTEVFPSSRDLLVGQESSIRVKGFEWSVLVVAGSDTFSVGDGLGGLTAELVPRTLDGKIHRMFSNRQLAAFTVDDGGRVMHRQ